jgi:hypothetical protein
MRLPAALKGKPSMKQDRETRKWTGALTVAPAIMALLVSATPAVQRCWTARTLEAQTAAHAGAAAAVSPGPGAISLRMDRLGALLASWQTVGGCGASAATGGGVGVKWIGRNVTGGLFTVQTLGSYSPPAPSDVRHVDHQYFLSTLITRDLDDAWSVGINVPYVYKYMTDPYSLNIDLSNSGLGDVFVQATHKFGIIHDTLVTAAIGLPTGKYATQYKMTYLRQHRQLGFGKLAASLTVDHTLDKIWGLVVVGATGAWRGGDNSIGNYRAPSGSAYAFAGYFLGPVVPAVGVSLTGFSGHDKDRGEDENTGLYLLSPTLSLEWSTPWVAVLAGFSLPYQYDGITSTAEGGPRSPWGFGSWSATLGISVSPF